MSPGVRAQLSHFGRPGLHELSGDGRKGVPARGWHRSGHRRYAERYALPDLQDIRIGCVRIQMNHKTAVGQFVYGAPATRFDILIQGVAPVIAIR